MKTTFTSSQLGFLLIIILFALIFTVIEVHGEYPEDCFIHDDAACFNLQKSPMTYWRAKKACLELGGISQQFDKTLNRSAFIRSFEYWEIPQRCFWIFDFDENQYCYWEELGKCSIVSCSVQLPSLCMIPLKHCRLSDLRDSIPNADFQNCKESFLPENQITIKCAEGYVLQKGSNIAKCRFDGTWSYTAECLPGCLPPKISNNSYLVNPKELYQIGEKAELLCNDNFITFRNHPITSLAVTCLETGLWSNSLSDCLPADKLLYHYNYFENKYFKKTVDLNEQVSLNVCKLEYSLDKRINSSITWLKDQVELNSLVRGQIIINETDFSIHFFSFSVEDEGVYTCIIKDTISTSVIEFCSYQLALKKKCKQLTPEHTHSLALQEDTNQIISCFSRSYIYKAHWFKDGQRIWGDNNRILLTDGSLYLKNVSVTDAGSYLCIYNDMQSFCEQKSQIIVNINRKPVCGRLDKNDMTLSGRPWLATLWNDGEVSPFCYATLIDSNWLVTSATCLFGTHTKSKPNILVKLGFTSNSIENTPVYEVSNVQLHPRYSNKNRLFDVALIKLAEPVIFTSDIYPICFLETNLQTENDCKEFQFGTVTGWGSLESVEHIGDLQLSNEILNIVNNNECNFITEEQSNYMFCAKGNTGIANVSGYSGSALEIKWKNRWYLWGLMSWGGRASRTGDVDYFSVMIVFREWIESIINS